MPMASAPASKAARASSARVMPQILTQMAMASALQQRVERGPWIVLAHECLADQECRDADLFHAGKLGGGAVSALGDQRDVVRRQRREPPRGVERGLKGMQVAIVDADQPGIAGERALE